MKRISEHPGAVHQREWWRTVNPEIRADVLNLYAEYYTPEQRADLTEFGACYFEAEDGSLFYMQVGHWPIPEPRPTDGRPYCMNVNVGYASALIAYKLLFQANIVGARSIAGREGARLTL